MIVQFLKDLKKNGWNLIENMVGETFKNFI